MSNLEGKFDGIFCFETNCTSTKAGCITLSSFWTYNFSRLLSLGSAWMAFKVWGVCKFLICLYNTLICVAADFYSPSLSFWMEMYKKLWYFCLFSSHLVTTLFHFLLSCMYMSSFLVISQMGKLSGATNRPQELDEAARRRLTKRLYIPLPSSGAIIYL